MKLKFYSWLAAVLLSGSVSSAAAETPPAGGRIAVASFNIRCPVDPPPNDWASRLPRIRTLLQKYRWDLLGLQEATVGQLNDLKRISLLDPESGTGDYDSVGVGRDDGREAGEFSCILYRRDRFTLLEGGTFWLSETPDEPGTRSWDSACNRVCSWGKFWDREAGRVFFFFNTHLDHVSAEARQNGMKLILERIRRIAGDLPVILAGDFNTGPESAPFAAAAAQLNDAARLSRGGHSGPEVTFNEFIFDPADGKHNLQIDHVFVSDGVEVLTHRTVDDAEGRLFASDHFPVAVDLILPE